MNKEIHFLEAINAGEPNADLIYADWLEEQGRPEADEIRDPAPVVLGGSGEWGRSPVPSNSLSGSYSFTVNNSYSQSYSESGGHWNFSSHSYSCVLNWSVRRSYSAIHIHTMFRSKSQSHINRTRT